MLYFQYFAISQKPKQNRYMIPILVQAVKSYFESEFKSYFE